MEIIFQCNKCGKCCESLNRSFLYDDLNDGNGTCKYYDKNTKLCTIYNSRPEKCNVEKFYKKVSHLYTYEEYIKLNYLSCELLNK